jgi:type I restriction enzyme S subunit
MVSKFKNIPVGWKVKLSSDVLFFQEGPGVRKWQFKEEGVKLLNGGNINNNTINLNSTKHYLSEDEAYNKYKHFLVDEGDLLIACSGITINTFYKKIAFIKSKDLPLCLNTSTMRFKSLAGIELRYFFYYLQTKYFTKQIQKLITGSAQLNFGPSHMGKIEILLPPIDQQKKIAAILDAADAYRQKTKALITKYEELTQSLFLDMFGDDTGTLTELGKVIKTVGGGTPSKDNEQYWNGNIPWASVKDLKSDRLTKTQDFITQSGVDNSATRVVPNGSLIVATRMAVGRAVICEMDVAINQDLKAIQTTGKINITYLLYLFKSKKNYFDSVSSGATVKGIKIEHITKLKVNLPNYSKQNQFADSVKAIEAQKAQAQASLAKAEDLFNSLLQRAFKGELS